MNIETTYDVVVLAEALLMLCCAALALALLVWALCNAWKTAAEAASAVLMNRAEWEEARQRMLHADNGSRDTMLLGYPVHADTAEFFGLDDE